MENMKFFCRRGRLLEFAESHGLAWSVQTSYDIKGWMFTWLVSQKYGDEVRSGNVQVGLWNNGPLLAEAHLTSERDAVDNFSRLPFVRKTKSLFRSSNK